VTERELGRFQLPLHLRKPANIQVLSFGAITAIMGVISGATIITSLSLFHITLAFFFLTSPDSIADQTLVFIIGEAMGMVGCPPKQTSIY
jgi:hypothetical protein